MIESATDSPSEPSNQEKTPVNFSSEATHEAKSPVDDTKEQVEAPIIENDEREQWNNPRINMYRYLSTIFAFIVMGMNDAAYGVSGVFT